MDNSANGHDNSVTSQVQTATVVTQSSVDTSTSTSPSTSIASSMKSPTQKTTKSPKKQSYPADGLAVAAFFFAAGVYLSYFPTDAHTPSVQGLFQFLAYCCYGVGFLGGTFELSKLSKSQFFETFGLGMIFLLITYGLHSAADLLQSIPVLPFVLRLLLVVTVGFSGYGVVRGVLFLIIKDEALSVAQQHTKGEPEAKLPREKMKPEQIAGIVIALLSVATALIQALPTMLPFFKQLLHIP